MRCILRLAVSAHVVWAAVVPGWAADAADVLRKIEAAGSCEALQIEGASAAGEPQDSFFILAMCKPGRIDAFLIAGEYPLKDHPTPDFMLIDRYEFDISTGNSVDLASGVCFGKHGPITKTLIVSADWSGRDKVFSGQGLRAVFQLASDGSRLAELKDLKLYCMRDDP